MTIATFNVVADDVRTDFFPHWSAFSTTTKPTAAAVASNIIEEAADLAGRLALKSISVDSITNATTPYAYQWCRKTLKLQVAVWVAQAATASNPELAKALEEELAERLEQLDQHGATVLVDVSASDTGSPPEGPTTHITEYSLETDDASCMSSTRPRLRRDDHL